MKNGVNMKITLIASVFLFLNCGFYGSGHAQTPDIEYLKKIPWNSGYKYRCDDMVRAVNHLRSLGKEKAIEVLDEYVTQPDPTGTENALYICRLLFVSTNGWKALSLGQVAPTINTNARARFPLFPVAITNGVPFFLVEGYRGGGRGSSPIMCVESCKGLSLIPADLSGTNYDVAALALTQSREFLELYPKSPEREEMTEMIVRQAKRE
jgi:hypothetical protein